MDTSVKEIMIFNEPGNDAIAAPSVESPARLPTHSVSSDLLEAVLRDALVDNRATITDYRCEPMAHLGTNDSSTLFRVELSWLRTTRSSGSNKATWIVKHWKAGGERDSALGITQPREVLAWERGWLRPAALPSGMVVPIIGATRSAGNREAWLVMEDVSPALSAYTRLALTGEEAVSRTHTLLDRLAHFHALWEEEARQYELHSSPWLRRQESILWDMAPTYAGALGHPPVAKVDPAAYAPPVWEQLAASLDAFLEGRPADERRLWEDLLSDRQSLVDALSIYPKTLLHNDLDDRNIGLRCSSEAAAARGVDAGEVILIDWEWMALGAAAIDVASVIQRLPVLIMPGTEIPEVVWGDDLANRYFSRYRAAGGRCVDASAWRRSFGLARIAQGLYQMPFIHGSMRRSIRGEAPLPEIIGVPPEVIRQGLRASLPTLKKMEEAVISEARRWLR